jgi:hypothetical protein
MVAPRRTARTLRRQVATLELWACLTGCATSAAVTGPIGIFLGIGCAALCWVYYLIEVASLSALLVLAGYVCGEYRTNALRACGLIVVQQ